MSLETRLLSLINAIGADVKTLMGRSATLSYPTTGNLLVTGTLSATGSITQAVPSGPTLQTAYCIINKTDTAPPANTPAGTLVIKKRT